MPRIWHFILDLDFYLMYEEQGSGRFSSFQACVDIFPAPKLAPPPDPGQSLVALP